MKVINYKKLNLNFGFSVEKVKAALEQLSKESARVAFLTNNFRSMAMVKVNYRIPRKIKKSLKKVSGEHYKIKVMIGSTKLHPTITPIQSFGNSPIIWSKGVKIKDPLDLGLPVIS